MSLAGAGFHLETPHSVVALLLLEYAGIVRIFGHDEDEEQTAANGGNTLTGNAKSEGPSCMSSRDGRKRGTYTMNSHRHPRIPYRPSRVRHPAAMKPPNALPIIWNMKRAA